MTVSTCTAAELQTWLTDGNELALLDVREAGQIGEGHILFSAPVPYSRFEIMLPQLAPNPAVRMVLVDNDDGVALRAAARAEALGYTAVHVLAGGVLGWASLGRTLFKGVNVPSKAFGELVEHACDTPRLSAAEVQERAAEIVLIDGRPANEYNRMTIPGAQNCPNGELALRIGTLVPDPTIPIVINCAGRTRSIIGAQTLRDLGLPNPVYALENGTQGWTLSGLELQRGAKPKLAKPEADLSLRLELAKELARRYGVGTISTAALTQWQADQSRTTFLLDVRTAEERAEAPAPAAVHAPGGQLVQATDQWIGVCGARVVIVDGGDVRALVVAAWLARLGHEVHVLEGGVPALPETRLPTQNMPTDLPVVLPADLPGDARILDLRASAKYRAGHLPGAEWAIRPRLSMDFGSAPIVLIADDPAVAQLAAVDLREAGVTDISRLDPAWQSPGTSLQSSTDTPSDTDRIDYLFFVHDRHDGNLAASQAYLDWETGLVAQLDPRERAVFKI
ncbi:MAG: rhodanese-like domain-containing protein [Paracoccaceae bacterium]